MKATLTQRTFIGLFWASGSAGIHTASHLLVLIVLARFLTPSDFGLVAAAQIITGIATVFAKLGVGPAVVQRSVLTPHHIRTAFTISLGFGVVLFGGVYWIAPRIAMFFSMPDLTSIVKVMAAVFVVQSFGTVAESLLKRNMDFRRLAQIDAGSLLVGYAALAITLGFLGFGPWALVWAHVSLYSLKTIALCVAMPHSYIPSIRIPEAKELLSFGTGFTLARMANYAAGQGDNLVIGRWLGAGALGVYGRAYHLMVAPATLIGSALDHVLFPAMAHVQNDTERLGRAFLRSTVGVSLAALPLSIIVIIGAPEIVRLMLGPQWEEVIAPLQVLSIGLLFRTSYKLSDSLARATGAVYRRAWRQAVYAFLVFSGAWAGTPWGILGVSVGVLIAIAVNYALMTDLSLRLLNLRWRQYFDVHIPAIQLTAILGLQSWFVAVGARSQSVPTPVTLIMLFSTAAFSVALLCWVRPRIFLGRDGLWLVEKLRDYIRFGVRGRGAVGDPNP